MHEEEGGPHESCIARARCLAIATIVAITVSGLAACISTPPTPTAPDYGLRTTLTPTGFLLEWNAPEGATPDAVYDVQSKVASGAWVDEPIATSTSAEVAGVPRTLHSFRVRLSSSSNWSKEVSATFVVPVLPVLRIDTAGRAPIVDKENYLQATIVLDPNGSDLPAHSGTTEIKGRGNTTWTFPKKPYRLKLTASTALAGMPSSKHWVLLANWMDSSQLRTSTVFDIASTMMTGLAWTPKYRHVEVVLNGAYHGVYMLVEQVRGASTRVPITAMTPSDNEGEALSGGYLLEVDEQLEANAEQGQRTTRNVPIVVKEPDPATPQQMSYAQSYVQAFEDALFTKPFDDPDGYRKYLDVDSLIDFYLVHELAKNQDTFGASTHFWKERSDPLLHFGPVWDFDVSMGNAPSSWLPNGWYTRTRGAWLPKLFEDPSFEAQVAARWTQLLPQLQTIPTSIRANGVALQEAVANDLTRWPREALGTPEWIADWMQDHIDWISEQPGY